MGDTRCGPTAFEPMMSSIFCISGSIAAGKTTWANRLAERLHLRTASFGDYLRKQLSTSDRNVLRKAGAQLVSRDPAAFARSVLDDAGWRPGESIIVDGIRHVSVVEALREIARPGGVVIFFADVNSSERLNRVRQRGDKSQLAQLDADSTEEDLPRLRELADIVVDSDVSLDEAIARINKHLSK